MKKIFLTLLLVLFPTTVLISKENTTDTKDSAASSTSTPSTSKSDRPRSQKSSGGIVIHRPQTDPAWGKVIQYHREQVGAINDKNHETLHEFLFQDDQGIVRTAIYHESTSAEGYWEVWIWDQP